MRIRIVDYVGNLGGGIRYSSEVLKALANDCAACSFELVSHGVALDNYRGALSGLPRLTFVRRRPLWSRTLAGIRRLPAGHRVLSHLGLYGFNFLVPPQLFRGADVVWFPWVHRHRLVSRPPRHVVGTFHDAIMMVRRDILPELIRTDEVETTRRWFASGSELVVTSDVTRETVTRLLSLPSSRAMNIIPVGFDHLDATTRIDLPSLPDWTTQPYVLCPANISPHKNHERLLEAMAKARRRVALVLTGSGSDLVEGDRAAALRAFANAQGFEFGVTLHALGTVEDQLYAGLLSRAWAVVMPTLAEGGGSFPVLEAMMKGVPVLCSDIPVMKEQVRRFGGSIGWFDPNDTTSLVAQLDALAGDYDQRRREAEAQRHQLRLRTWRDVARDYQSLFARVVSPAAGGAARAQPAGAP